MSSSNGLSNVCKHTRTQAASRRRDEMNSTYIMLECLVEQCKAINLHTLNREGVETLSNTEWELAERIASLLKPFYEATIEISHDDAGISTVVPIIAMLNKNLHCRRTKHTMPVVQVFRVLQASLLRLQQQRRGYTWSRFTQPNHQE